MTNSLVFGIYCLFLLVLLLYMKKTDPMVGCEKWRQKGCNRMSGSECKFPTCASLEKYRNNGKEDC